MKKTILLFALTVCTVVASHSQTTDYFPLSTFDKTIWDPNKFASFDDTTGVFIADQYGFGGWGSGATPLDLSAYKYLVMNFVTDPSSTGTGAALRVFDGASYWGTPAEATFVTKTQAVVDLQNAHKMKDTIDTGALNPSTIYIVGVWTYGWSGKTGDKTNAVTIKNCYVTNNDDYSKTITGISIPTIKENKLVDVYTITGSRIRSQVLANDATKGLDKGLYLIGNKKVLVTEKH
jgi:hypothetical protein